MGWGWGSGLAAFVVLAACGGGEFTAQGEGTAGNAGATGSGGTEGSGDSTAVVASSAVASVGSATSSGAGGDASSSGAGGASSSGGSAGTATGGRSGSAGAGGQAGTNPMTTTGGTVDAGGPREASSPDDAARDAALDGPITTKCPPVEPGPSGYCADGLDCTYGTHPRPSCRKDYLCSGSHWTVTPPMACADPPKCENEMPFPLVGGMCAPAEHDCLAASGLYCRCHPAAGAMAPTWDCYPSPMGCPTTPPNKGQACDLNARTCDYGTCGLGSRVTTSCSGGIFRWSIMCP